MHQITLPRPICFWKYFLGLARPGMPGNQRIEVKFDRAKRSRATGHLGTVHVIAPGDGDIFLND